MKRRETPDFRLYGDDAEEAWNIYTETGNTDAVAAVIADRLRAMNPGLLRQLYVIALVFARR